MPLRVTLIQTLPSSSRTMVPSTTWPFLRVTLSVARASGAASAEAITRARSQSTVRVMRLIASTCHSSSGGARAATSAPVAELFGADAFDDRLQFIQGRNGVLLPPFGSQGLVPTLEQVHDLLQLLDLGASGLAAGVVVRRGLHLHVAEVVHEAHDLALGVL